MKPQLLVPALVLSLLAACERPATVDAEAERRRVEELTALDERIARLQELEDRAAQRDAATAAEERARLLEEKEQLQGERDRLSAARRSAEAQASRARDDAAAAAREARAAEDRARAAEAAAAETAGRAERDRALRQVDFFYPALEPHGEWVQVDGLGYTWQPRVAERRGWRPYTDGRWVFTEYGWTWNSHEPFGWAVYHYGRWAKLRRLGWVWVPGTEWGPAWVAWRRSDDYIGWAPLPPEAWSGTGFNAAVDSYYDIGPGSYAFVPVASLGAESYVGKTVDPEQNVTIINKTVNITNVTYKTVKNTTVVYNAGPDLERVNARAATKVPRLQVERVTEVAAAPKATNATRQEGGVLRMVAPRLEQGGRRPAPAPQRVKERVKDVEVDRGWAAVADAKAAQQAREQVKREAAKAEVEEREKARPPREQRKEEPVRRATPAAATPEPKPAAATPLPPRPAGEQAMPAPVEQQKAEPVRRASPGGQTLEPRAATPIPAPRPANEKGAVPAGEARGLSGRIRGGTAVVKPTDEGREGGGERRGAATKRKEGEPAATPEPSTPQPAPATPAPSTPQSAEPTPPGAPSEGASDRAPAAEREPGRQGERRRAARKQAADRAPEASPAAPAEAAPSTLPKPEEAKEGAASGAGEDVSEADNAPGQRRRLREQRREAAKGGQTPVPAVPDGGTAQ